MGSQLITSNPCGQSLLAMAIDTDEFRKFVFGDADRFREIKDFGISFGMNVLFATLVLCAFTYLRPRNKAVYARRLRWFEEGDKRPPEIPGDNSPGLGVLGSLRQSWVRFIFNTPESLILEKLGVDSLMFIRTLALFVRAFIPIAVISAGALIPVDLVLGTTFIQPTKQVLALLTMENLESVNLKYLWIHTAAAWIFSIYVFYLVYTAYCDFVVLRQQFFTSHDHQRKISSRSLLCVDLPKALREDGQFERLFRDNVHDVPPTCAAVGRRVGPLADLIEGHEKAVRKLEMVLARYLKGGTIAAKRPTIKIKGRKEDAIEYWTCLIQNFERKIADETARSAKFKATDFGFVSFASVVQAHKAALVLRPTSIRKEIMRRAHREKLAEGDAVGLRGSRLPEFMLAPEPKDIIWSNLSLTPATRRSRSIIGKILTLALCLFWIFPLVFIASVAKISVLFAAFPALDNFATSNPRFMGFLEQQVAPILQSLFIVFLPTIFSYITTFQAARTKTGAQRAVFTKLYFFLVLTNIFFFALLNVAEGVFTTVARSMAAGTPISLRDFGIINILTRELLNTGNHFLALVSVRGLLSQPLELAQAAALIGVSIKRWLFASTPRQDREFSKPPPMDFAVQYAFHLFIFTVAFLFAPLVPLISVAGLVYFVVTYHVYKYQCLYVFDTRIETGGRMWPLVVERIFASQVIAQLAMAAVLWARGGKIQSYTMLPLVLITVALHHYTVRYIKPRTKLVAAVYPAGVFKISGTPATRRRGASAVIPPEDFEYYDDSEAFERASLADRFMLPALARPLITPQVHKAARHLLPQVYGGRLDARSDSADAPRKPMPKFMDNSDADSVYSFDSSAPFAHPPRTGGPRSRLSMAAAEHIGRELSEYYQAYNHSHEDAISEVGEESRVGAWDEYTGAGPLPVAVPLDYSRVGQMFAKQSVVGSYAGTDEYDNYPSEYTADNNGGYGGPPWHEPPQQYHDGYSSSGRAQLQQWDSVEMRSLPDRSNMYTTREAPYPRPFEHPASPRMPSNVATRFSYRRDPYDSP